MVELRVVERWSARRTIAVVVAVSVVVAGLVAVVHRIVTEPGAPPLPSGNPVTGVREAPMHFEPPLPDASTVPYVARPVTWPEPGTTTVELASSQAAVSAGVVALRPIVSGGGYGGPREATVRMLDRQTAGGLGVSGVVFTIEPTGGQARSGRVDVSVDYSGFVDAYGGNYASRLRLVQLDPCALSSSSRASCRRPIGIESSNDREAMTVTAPATLATATTTRAGGAGLMVFALTSDPGTEGGDSGTYAATDLKASGTWSAGGNSGAFAYNNPITIPAGPSALAPAVSLSYSSASADGQTSATYAQAGWAGDGWTTPRSYIEQTFTACSNEPGGTPSPKATSDMCQAGPILTLSLNGSSTALVWDAGLQVWKPSTDDGSVITHVTNSNNGSGTYNTDHWTVTTRDGTVYSFGRNQLPGWSAGKPTTNSVDYQPVYGAHPGDPCYSASGFDSSWCVAAYRWNLDYAVDTHGNAMSYYYKQDTNFYARNDGAAMAQYVRDSYLDRIEYGFVDGGAYGTVPNRIEFVTGDRCVSGTCQPLDDTTKANWPDVPYDLACGAGASCTSSGPAYFSTVRLAQIVTKQWSTSSSSYQTVDTYTLTHTMPATGDSSAPTLWLSRIDHTASGATGAAVTYPPVQFGSIALANRTNAAIYGLQPFFRHRMYTITTETGSVIAITYSLTDPCAVPVTQDPATNTKSCFPVRWTPPLLSPIVDWFNKYAVTKVTQSDPTGGAPALTTTYNYLGGIGWHYDDNELVQAKYRTYGQFRGYGTVQTLTGDIVNDPQTLSETTFYRGMSKNNNTTVVNLTDSQGGQHEDHDQLAGMVLESTEYLGNGGAVDNSTITSYFISTPTATRARTGLDPLTANWFVTAETFTRQAVTSTVPTTWRYTQTNHSYVTSGDHSGLLHRTYSHTVPADPAYDRCTTYTYAAANPAKNLVGLVSETETVSVACGGFTVGSPASAPAGYNTLTSPSASRPSQVVAHTRTFYDDHTWDATFPQPAPPGNSDVTMTLTATDYQAGAYTYVKARTKYDAVGRVIEQYDGRDNKTATTYTLNNVGLITGQAVTNPLNQVTSGTQDPQRGSALTSTDANGIVTSMQYDGAGRVIAVWAASRPTSAPAHYLFSYVVSNTGLTYVTTQKMNKSQQYTSTVTILDALYRPRQVQAPTPSSGQRVITDTFYDSRGWVHTTFNGWWDPGAQPDATLVTADDLDAQVFNKAVTTYDGLGRTVFSTSYSTTTPVSFVATVYSGDRTTTVAPAAGAPPVNTTYTPPVGGITSTTGVDPLGRQTELKQYETPPLIHVPANPFTGVLTVTGGTTIDSTFGYDGHGRQDRVTDAAGNDWISVLNIAGQATTKTDPDAGTSTGIVYDGNGNLLQSTNSLGATISYTYDALNRKTGMYASTVDTQASTNQLSKWVYDNSDNAIPGMPNPIGHLTAGTSYAGGHAYTIQETGFNPFGKSLGTRVVIPSAAEGTVLGGGTPFQVNRTYEPQTGLLTRESYPFKWGLPGENVNYGYSGVLDMPTAVGGLSGYAVGTAYDEHRRPTQVTLGSPPNNAFVTNLYNPHTGWLDARVVTRTPTTPTDVDRQDYTRDVAGNITKQTSTRLGAATPTETQCLTYDHLVRLTEAWTATNNCATAPSAGVVGSSLGTASAYWTTWRIDNLGQREEQIDHSVTGGPETTTTYAYNGNGANQPHTLTATTRAGAYPGGTSYEYDSAGNLTRRNAGNGDQILAWNDAGKLTSVSGSTGGTSSYIYDADGNILLQNQPGATTLYLPGQQTTLNTATNTATSVRYYALPGGCTAIRTGAGTNYTFAIADHHGTGDLLLNNTAQTPTWRQSTPFGAPRGAAITWPDNRGFLNKPNDTNTGLTIIGARNYDPGLGRFVSLDSIFNVKNPRSWDGYGYANHNPLTYSDPSGLDPGGGQSCDAGRCGGAPRQWSPYPTPMPNPSSYPVPTSNPNPSPTPTPPQPGVDAGANMTPGPSAQCYSRGGFWLNGSCLTAGMSQIRQGNLDNGSNGFAIGTVLGIFGGSQSDCKLGQYQIICFGVDASMGQGRPVTIGDVLFYPESESNLNALLNQEQATRAWLSGQCNSRGRCLDGDFHGPNLMAHEAKHSDQWAQSPGVAGFAASYGIDSLLSATQCGSPGDCNWYELEANPYHGGYWQPPELDNGEFVDENGNIIPDHNLVFRN